MGSKTEARRVAQEGGAPVVPGTERRACREPVIPVMLKAVAGGGGKGMRRVDRAEDLAAAFEAASSEALRAFGDGRIYVEKLIENARHIEIQVFGDQHGNMVHLGERECSVQRRHQKVIEESPSPLVALQPGNARAHGRGSDQSRRAPPAITTRARWNSWRTTPGNFYFLEMNTRLQVEHPVTELVTGLDLVRLQIEIAAGAPLPFTQDQVALRGAAIECRIYAEDPGNNFFPSPGQNHATGGALRPRRAARFRHLSGLDRAARIRSHAGEAHRLGRYPRARHRADAARARRISCGRHQDEYPAVSDAS